MPSQAKSPMYENQQYIISPNGCQDLFSKKIF